jgi:Ca2+-dependent lipid-binding protein
VDPYVEVSVRDGRSLSTRVVWNDANPVFDEVMNFIVDDPKQQSVKAYLKEHDFHAFQKVSFVDFTGF